MSLCSQFPGDESQRKGSWSEIPAVKDSCGRWPLKDREPCPLETTLPRVLAAGDIRAGSTKRVGFAVGDGSLAVMSIHKLTAIRR